MHGAGVWTFYSEYVIPALRRNEIGCELFNVVCMVAFRREVLNNVYECWI